MPLPYISQLVYKSIYWIIYYRSGFKSICGKDRKETIRINANTFLRFSNYLWFYRKHLIYCPWIQHFFFYRNLSVGSIPKTLWLKLLQMGVFFTITVILNSCVQLLHYKLPLQVFVYDNPIVVIGAAVLFLFFNNISIKYSRFINYVAKSSFAVYLLHTNPNILTPIYKPLCQSIYSSYGGIECLGVFVGVLILIFTLSIIVDIPRRFAWEHIKRITSR